MDIGMVVGSDDLLLRDVPSAHVPGRQAALPQMAALCLVAGAYLGFVIIVLAVKPRLGLEADIPDIRNPLGVGAMEAVGRWVDGPGNFLYLLFAVVSALRWCRGIAGRQALHGSRSSGSPLRSAS